MANIALAATFASDNYIIYENVRHTFDGPIISNVSSSVSDTTVTVTWDTNVNSDSFVVYDTASDFSTSKEQGSSAKDSTGHTVELTGLEESTTYYYRVRSERVNGGVTTDMTQRTFTTGTEDDGTAEPPSIGGGGILIIDKTDKAAPIISDLTVAVIDDETVDINWITDEPSTSFVEYGLNSNFGRTYGNWARVTEHSVRLENLNPNTLYHFRAISSDDWGNIGYSEERVFTTEDGIVEEGEEPGVLPEETEEDTASRLFDLFGRLFPEVSLNQLGEDPLRDIQTLEDITGFIPAPILSGTPEIEIGATEATIRWNTDIEASSFVAVAPDGAYNPSAEEPYQQIVGVSEELVTEHEVTVYGLSPDTLYHIQLRSKAELGPMARSRDFTFRTNLEELSITSFYVQIIDNQTANFRWVTNKEADSAIQFSPYRGNILAIDQNKVIRDNAVSVIHEIEVGDFEGGTFYEVELVSTDLSGNVATEVIDRFSTSEDDLPPTISYLKADSTVFVDRSDKIQTIISWLTNEPSTSRVYYQEGVHGGDVELAESTSLNTNYTKEHVMVISKFKPGVVYTFRAESIDSGGNMFVSKPHTFMTAKKSESIIQIIMNILEDTFGWMKDIV